MREIKNDVEIYGYLYEVKLNEIETTVDGKREPAISGIVSIATDDEGTNILQVNYFARPTWSGGKPNPNFNTLKTLMNAETWLSAKEGVSPRDNATLVRVSHGSISSNDWFDYRNASSTGGEPVLDESPRIRGSFISIVKSLPPVEQRNSIVVDCLIGGAYRVMADPDNGIGEDYLKVNAYGFGYGGKVFPLNLTLRNPAGFDYTEGLAFPCFTKVYIKATNVSHTTSQETRTAFGDPIITEKREFRREYEIYNFAEIPYEFNEDSLDLTPAEWNNAKAERQVFLAEKKEKDRKRYYEKNSSSSTDTSFGNPMSTISFGNFDINSF